VKGVAAWLVARPYNAVIALAASVAFASVPALSHMAAVSSIVLIAVALYDGVKLAVIKLVFAALVAVGIGMVAGISPALIASGAATVWLPALLLVVLLTVTRSLTLTLQLSVLLAVVVLLVFLVAIGDATAFWEELLVAMVKVWRDTGQAELADLVEPQLTAIAEYATMAIVMASWLIQAISLALGYALYRLMPGELADYGRFRRLDFGRVIAMTMAVASVLSMFVDAMWLQSVAFIMFAAFWLQGLAVVHWLHARGILQMFGIIATYALMLVAGWFVMPALAVFGYTDAWFDFRRMMRQREKQD
jgi:hypothetical protein